MLKRALKQFLAEFSMPNKIGKSKKTIIVAFAIFILALLPRVLWLKIFPPSMIHDELNYVMNAKSLFHDGRNIPWTASSAFSWGENVFDVVISEIPSVITAPWIGPNELNQFNARIPYALISSITVMFVYLISREILEEKVAVLSGLLMAFNPWSIHFGRTALELNFSSLFYIMGIYIIIKSKEYKILYALPIFILGFLSYLGAKLLFLPVIIITLIFKYFSENNKRKYVSPIKTFMLLSFTVFAVYTLTINSHPAGTRTDELLIFDSEWTSQIVNEERRQAIPNAGLNIFSNKAVVLIRRVADVYLHAFSSTGLFARGETVSVYSTWEHGQFYYLDFPLILMGLIALYSSKKKRKVFWFIVTLILISPIVSSIDMVERTFAVRSFTMFPFLVILSAKGAYHIKDNFKFSRAIITLIAVLYAGSVMYFLNLYFFRYPVYAAERWFFSERIIANYIRLSEENKNEGHIYVVPYETAKTVFEEYLFYSGNYNTKHDVQKVNKKMDQGDFSYKNATFLDVCPENIDFGHGDVLISDRRKGCIEKEEGNLGILQVVDAGTVFIIKNDTLCNDYELPRYYRPMSVDEFRVEEMDTKDFCRSWIARY